MSDLVKTRAMLRWHIPVGQVAIDGRSWWQVACGRTIRQASALTASAAGRDLCAVCARSVVAEKIVTYPSSADRITSDTVSPRDAARACAADHRSSGMRTFRAGSATSPCDRSRQVGMLRRRRVVGALRRDGRHGVGEDPHLVTIHDEPLGGLHASLDVPHARPLGVDAGRRGAHPFGEVAAGGLAASVAGHDLAVEHRGLPSLGPSVPTDYTYCVGTAALHVGHSAEVAS